MTDSVADRLGWGDRERLAFAAVLSLGVAAAASWGFLRTLDTVYPASVAVGLGLFAGTGVFVAFWLELRTDDGS